MRRLYFTCPAADLCVALDRPVFPLFLFGARPAQAAQSGARLSNSHGMAAGRSQCPCKLMNPTLFPFLTQVAPEGDMPESCAICLEDFTSGDEQRTLPCPHGAHFHRKCIDPWLTIHQTCPLCKTNFLRAAAAVCL